MSKDQDSNALEKSSHSLEASFDEDQLLDHDEVMRAIRNGELRTIPKNVSYEVADYVHLNKLRKRRRYVKIEISEEQYSRLLACSRKEKIPMRFIATRAVELYLNDFAIYGFTERSILQDITPFDDESKG